MLMVRRGRASQVCLMLCLFVLLAGVIAPGDVGAQVQQGATITILRGQVAVIRPDGSAVQPAPSGTTVDAGDEIRTISRSGALITFYSGTEIELGEETILVVEQVSRQGDTVNISLRQVLGATVNRVQSLAGSGSTYQIQAGGAVALVRGTTFALVGPVTTSVGNVVTIACLEDCTPASTFNGCGLAPFSGYGVVTSGGKVDSACYSFAVGRSEGLFDAATQGVTTMEQAIQGDTRGVPAGQVAAGARQETEARQGQSQDTSPPKDQVTETGRPLPPPGGPPGPPGPEPQPCNATTTSGGTGTTVTFHELGRTSGTFNFRYEAFGIPDRFQIEYEGNTILDTGFVSNSAVRAVTYNGTTTVVKVTVTGNTNVGTAWNYTVFCPT